MAGLRCFKVRRCGNARSPRRDKTAEIKKKVKGSQTSVPKMCRIRSSSPAWPNSRRSVYGMSRSHFVRCDQQADKRTARRQVRCALLIFIRSYFSVSTTDDHRNNRKEVRRPAMTSLRRVYGRTPRRVPNVVSLLPTARGDAAARRAPRPDRWMRGNDKNIPFLRTWPKQIGHVIIGQVR
jgi:hypothetical protein